VRVVDLNRRHPGVAGSVSTNRKTTTNYKASIDVTTRAQMSGATEQGVYDARIAIHTVAHTEQAFSVAEAKRWFTQGARLHAASMMAKSINPQRIQALWESTPASSGGRLHSNAHT
jgi:hypothetical protein